MIEALARDPRVRVRTKGAPDPDGTCVVYWMQRAQRAVDNPALDVAIELGNAFAKPVVTFFAIHPFSERANLRHYTFMIEGLPDTARHLRKRRVGFVVRSYPRHELLAFLDEVRPSIVVGDENPLRDAETRRHDVSLAVRVPFWTVDADVVVPSLLLDKEQYAARTIRPRLHEQIRDFLRLPREESSARVAWPRARQSDADPEARLLDGLPIDRSVSPVAGFRGGTAEARRRLRRFIGQRLHGYETQRNHPEVAGTSLLSPYLHFGHIGPREVGIAVRDSGAPPGAIAAFLEQLVVRRELATNFATFNPNYDRLAGCERWARKTLASHHRDKRPYLYRETQLEEADTHDPLWNAAQTEMVTTGWMHGYMRMYWAKKILEWTSSPEEAFAIAVRLNDRYELDGRDPNGYANIAWAIGGKHDRPWPPRPVFGTVRSMSYDSTRRKFDAQRYIDRVTNADRATS